MKFIDVAVPKFGDDESTQDAPHRVTTANQHPSLRKPQPIEEYNLDDTRSILSAKTSGTKEDEGTSDGKGGDQFYESQDPTTDVSSPNVITPG